MSRDSHAEWDAYVEEVRSLCATRGIDYLRSFAEKLERVSQGQWLCLSPIRTEKTPSFRFHEGDRPWWHDFGGAQKSGDLIALVIERQGCSYREAIDELARFFGIHDWDARRGTMKGAAPDPATMLRIWHEDSVARRIFGIATALAHLCHELLPTRVREHLREHYGLSDAYLDLEKIGYCPASLLAVAHEQLAYSDEELLSTGWFGYRKKTDGSYEIAPTFADRIVFPYWKDSLCQYAIGREFLAGAARPDVRAIYFEDHPEDQGKYRKLPVRNPDDPDKHKHVSPFVQNDVLWGEDSLRRVRDGVVFITEGVTDAASLAMLGFPVVSPVTVAYRNRDVERVTALFKHHRIRRIVILNDNDTTPDNKHPGLDGARKMAAGLWAAGFDVRIARLPRPEGASKIDVNEIVANIVRGRADRDAAEAEAKVEMQRIVDAAENYPEFLISETPKKLAPKDLEPWVSDLGTLSARMNVLEREDLFAKLHRHLGSIPKRPLRNVFSTAVAKAELAGAAPSADPGDAAPPGAAMAAAAAGGGGAGDGARRLRGSVQAHPNGYYERENASGVERISTFRLEILRRLAYDKGGPDWLCVRAVGPSKAWDAIDGVPSVLVAEWIVPPLAWVSRRAFVTARPNEKMVFNGSDEDLGGILELLTNDTAYETCPRIRSTGVLGRHVAPDGTLRFVLVAGTLGPDGQWMTPADLVYQPDGGSNLASKLPREPIDLAAPEILATAKTLFEGVFALHQPEAVGAILCWLMGSLFGPVVRMRLGVGPLLNVFGSPGSGKTSLMKLLWATFVGVVNADMMACDSTAFVNTRDFSSANALALMLDELKTDMGFAWERLTRILRRVYSGETESRGRADQGMNHYSLNAFVGVLGEERVAPDHALSERTVFVGVDGNWIAMHAETREAYGRLKDLPLHEIAPLLAGWSLRTDALAMITAAGRLADTTIARLGYRNIPTRVRVNLTFVAFGALGIDAFALEIGAQMTDVSLERIFRFLLRNNFEEDEGTDGEQLDRVRNNVDLFVIDAATMANLGLISDGKHYVVRDGKVYLWLAGIESQRAEWRRGQGLPGHGPRVLPLARTAREMVLAGTTYVVDASAREYFDDNRRLRCIVVELSKIPSSFGIDSFPTHPLKSYEAGNKSKTAEEMRERWRKN
jgi:hypothetical protein